MARFSHLLNETLTLRRFVSRDTYGDSIYGAAVALRCAVKNSFKLVRDADGSERVSTHEIVTDVRIGLEDRVWLPGDDAANESSSRNVMAVADDAARTDGMRLYSTFL